MYIHEQQDWPDFTWNKEVLSDSLASIRFKQGRLLGQMQGLGFRLQEEASLRTLTQDVIKSSEIEGAILDYDQVRSSIARRLGIDIGGLIPADRNVEGVVEMMLDATQNFDVELTKERMISWHAALFPTGRSGMFKIRVGKYRNDAAGPMQVVSGGAGREKVHFEAPAAERLNSEMKKFLRWFNKDLEMDPVIKSGVAHLWFVTIHPFDDGNGRIARAIADMELSSSEQSTSRFYSMSSQIRTERKSYYRLLELTQRGDLDITDWLDWYLGCLEKAIDNSQETLSVVIQKAKFWDVASKHPINDRQRSIINRLFEGFEGKLTTSKWAKLAKCSQDTALRDIQSLIDYDLMKKDQSGGRSTSYSLKLKN